MAKVETSAMRWPDPKKGPWWVQSWFVRIDGRLECVGLELWKGYAPIHRPEGTEAVPFNASGSITGTDLRHLTVAEMQAALRLRAAAGERHVREAIRSSDIPDREAIIAGMHEWDDHELETVAAIYRRAWENHDNPRQAIAEALNLSPTTASRRIRAARDGGLLGETVQGKAGEIKRPRRRKKGQL